MEDYIEDNRVDMECSISGNVLFMFSMCRKCCATSFWQAAGRTVRDGGVRGSLAMVVARGKERLGAMAWMGQCCGIAKHGRAGSFWSRQCSPWFIHVQGQVVESAPACQLLHSLSICGTHCKVLKNIIGLMRSGRVGKVFEFFLAFHEFVWAYTL